MLFYFADNCKSKPEGAQDSEDKLPALNVSPNLAKRDQISPKLTRLKSFRRGLSKRSILSTKTVFSTRTVSPCFSNVGRTNVTPPRLLYVYNNFILSNCLKITLIK